MQKEAKQEYKIEEVNKPTKEESEQQIKKLSDFLGNTWELPIETT